MTISANVTGLGTGGGGPFVVRCRVVRLRHILNKVITLRNPCPVLFTLHQHLAKLAFGSYFDSVRDSDDLISSANESGGGHTGIFETSSSEM